MLDELAADKFSFEHPTHQKILQVFREHLEKDEVPNEKFFTSHPEPDISDLAVDLLSDQYELSKNWEKHKIFVKTEKEDLKKSIERAILTYRRVVLEAKLPLIAQAIKEAVNDDDIAILLQQYKALKELQMKISEVPGIVITK